MSEIRPPFTPGIPSLDEPIPRSSPPAIYVPPLETTEHLLQRIHDAEGIGTLPAPVGGRITGASLDQMRSQIAALQRQADELQKKVDNSQITDLQKQADALQRQIDELKTSQTQKE